jgi:hypothetical protein
MKRFTILTVALAALGASLWTAAAAQRTARPTMDVYKSPTCGCCSIWVKHLEANGFDVRSIDVDDIYEIKQKHRVPGAVESCHTGVVDGLVVEGHVPAADVHRLLKERPAGVAGIGVRGMPIGSPGMEVAGVKPQPYSVLAFDKQGQTRVFAQH